MDTVRERFADDKARLDALLEFANNATGESDANIGDAIKTLCDGFGQGGSGWNVEAGEYTATTLSDYNNHTIIRHSLGEQPKAFIIWQKDRTLDSTDSTLKVFVIVFGETTDYVALAGRRSASSKTTWQYTTIADKNTVIVASDNAVDIRDSAWSFARIQPGITYEYMVIGSSSGGGSGDTQLPYKVTEVPITTRTQSITIPVEPHDYYEITFTSEADFPTSGYMCYGGGGVVASGASTFTCWSVRRQGANVNNESVKMTHSVSDGTITILSGVYFAPELSPYIVGVRGIDL